MNQFIIALAVMVIVVLVLTGSIILMVILVGIPILFYILVIWFFHQQAIIVKHRGPIETLGRSRELVKGTWWQVFGIGVVFGLLLLLLALSLPGVIINLVFGIFNDSLVSLIITPTNVLVLRLLGVSATVVCIDLRVRKRGYDLDAVAAELRPLPSGFSV